MKVALVTMPWASTLSPSIQCGLLKAILVREGHQVDVHYANLLLADRLGPERYLRLNENSGARNDLLGDWLFTKAAFREQAVPPHEYFAQVANALDGLTGETHDAMAELHDSVLPAFIEELADEVNWGSYDLIGFSTVFDQNVACLALSQAIKERHPQVPIVFGGGNCDGEMGDEYLRVIPWIDYVVRGEGDRVLPAMVEAIAGGRTPVGIPGLSRRDGGDVVSGGQAPQLADLSGSPVPDYTEYFDLLARLGERRMLHGYRPRIPFESSRGCWWGAKHHCTFCGLNALGMDYRRKPVDQVLAEVDELAGRYKSLKMFAVDNIIDHASISQLCEGLFEQGHDYEFFFEVKANLTRAQIAMMARAGITRVQPGIESLSTHVLQLMRKGTTRLLNVRMLKWGAAYGMTVNWNILAGFPGETSADYREQAELIPLLVHLQPPLGAHRIWLERFSPNFFETDRGFNDIKPLECYRFAYPVPGIDLSQIAYFYDYKAENTVSDQDLKLLQDAVGAWQELWRGRRTPLLRYFSGPGWIRVVDSRSGKARKVMLTGDEVKVFKAVEDTERSVSAVSRELGLSETRVQAILGELVEGGLALEEDGHYLGLAMPLERHLNRGLDGRRGPRSESPSSARRDLPMVIRDTEGAPAR